tara:strand:- start:2 stop:916 length:915 start_codon:yes stop_codon:yes gene_type:complete
MKNKLIIRLSNNLGNQMFMYASAFAFAKELNRELFIDDETAFGADIKIHNYNLDSFNLNSKIAPGYLKFLGLNGYVRRKILKYLDKFSKIKNFYVEPRDLQKNTMFEKNALSGHFKDSLFIEGHFETEKYFIKYANEIKNEFTFKNENLFKNNPLYKDIKNSNSVSICVRQNRFSEKKRAITKKDENDSLIFSKDQINYINKAINVIKSKISNPKFFLWSNDFKNLATYFSNKEYFPVSTNKIDLDLFLMSQAKHFVVVPSSYNWWGAWLANNNNKIIIRPADVHFTNFRINNRDLWPTSWIEV